MKYQHFSSLLKDKKKSTPGNTSSRTTHQYPEPTGLQYHTYNCPVWLRTSRSPAPQHSLVLRGTCQLELIPLYLSISILFYHFTWVSTISYPLAFHLAFVKEADVQDQLNAVPENQYSVATVRKKNSKLTSFSKGAIFQYFIITSTGTSCPQVFCQCAQIHFSGRVNQHCI